MRLSLREGAVLLLAMALPTYGFVADQSQDFAAASENIRHVKQLTYEDVSGEGANQGTDLEFATLTLSSDAVAELAQQLGEPPRSGGVGDADHELPGIQRTYAFAGSYDNGLQIVDVTDPEETRIVAVYGCGISQGDVQVFTRDDHPGRTFVTYTQDDGYGTHDSQCIDEARELGLMRLEDPAGTFIAEVTDPYEPTTVSWVKVPKGSHNQTVHPGGRYLYNSNSDLITSVPNQGIEVFDISDFLAPRHLGTLELPVRPGLGTESHDLTFSEDGTRAYSAALSQTVIIDTSNPAWPTIISSFVDPAINVEHQSDPVTLTDATTGMERDFLIIEDEVAGATETGQCPNGGVHVYDITGDLEQTPVKVGYWNIAEVRKADGDLAGVETAGGIGRCTAHVFQLHPDEQLMTIAYYNGGVRVVDISGLVGVALGGEGVGMKEVAFARFADSDTWAVKAPYVDRDGKFYVYGNDQRRGMDVYEVDLGDEEASAAASVNLGTWMTPQEAATFSRLHPVDLTNYTPYCLLGDRLDS